MDNATQPSTQPYTDPRRRGMNNSGLGERDVADIICILHPNSLSAHKAIAATARHEPQHILQRDQLVYEPEGDITTASSDDIALRFSSQVKNPGLGFCFGRNSSRCDILLVPDDREKKISNTHFRIYLNSEGILMLEDISTNGTIVDDKLIRKDRKYGSPTTQMLVAGSIIEVAGGDSVSEVKFIVRIPSRDEFEGQYTRNLIQYLNRVRQFTQKAEEVEKRGTPFLVPQQVSHSHGMHWNGGSKYNVTGQIGKGAFATVYKLATKDDGALYACKELDKRRLMKNNVLDHKVDSEMRIMRGLQHPNIVRFHDYHDHDNRWIYIIMEYVAGGELSAWLSQVGHLEESIVKTIARQILHALQYLHRRKITHRDIKPDNILIASFNPLRVKLSDFGLSKVVQEETFMKTFCGTLLYCAPEVYPEYENYRRGEARKRRRLGDPAPKTSPYDQSVDMWSFGAVLFHILCGHPPYMGRGDDRGAQMLRNIMTTDADYDMLRNVGVSEEGIDFISRLLNRDPKARPKEAECFQHPWLVDVPDEFDYMELDGPAPPEVNTELGAVPEAHEEEDEEELDASALEINDEVSDDEFFGQKQVEVEQSKSSSASGPANVKRPRVEGQHEELGEEQVVMTQQLLGEIRYPSLPKIASYELNPSVQLESTNAPAGRRLFGEIPRSALRSSNILGDFPGDRSLDLPEFQEPQNREVSFSDWTSSSFEDASRFALSLDAAAQTHHDVLRPSTTGLTASSLMGAESLVGQLNMESFTSQPSGSTDPNSENATSPEQEAGPAEDSATREPPNLPNHHRGRGSEQETPHVEEFSRRIELEPHPSLSSQGSYTSNGRPLGKSRVSSTNGSHRQSKGDRADGRTEADNMAAELARTIDERTGEEVQSFAQSQLQSEPDVIHHLRPAEGEEARNTADEDRDKERTDPFIKPPRLLGKLIPLANSIIKEPIRLESRMTSWGRGMNTTVRYPDPMDTRIPSYALELTFWAPAIEARIAEGHDWTQLPGVVTIVSTKTSKCIWVNDVELRSETPDKDAYLFGKVYTGDIITVYRSKEQSLRFRCEFYHGESVKTRAEATGGDPAQKKFLIEKAKKVRVVGQSKTMNATMRTTVGSTMTSATTNNGEEKAKSVEGGGKDLAGKVKKVAPAGQAG
ncbi:hypothetical protein VTO42DRAFT_7966 [Malbranchea cinnamomea]